MEDKTCCCHKTKERTEEEVKKQRLDAGIVAAYKMVDTCAAEFAAETPYYYSVYGGENEAFETKNKKKGLVLGSGPIRIGQGIEFDFCSVHCTWAFAKEGYETIIVNNNPETVSTDFDIADKLYFEPLTPEDVEKYRKELNIQEHNDDTVRDDFFVFLEERDYSLSYKMPFLLSFIDHMDTIGDAKIEDVLTDYIAFYQDRIDKGLPVDRPSCPYNAETLKDRKMIKSSMLTNPFEKFERKRFMYYSKDLGVISLNHALLAKMSEGDWERVKGQMKEDLERYYKQV